MATRSTGERGMLTAVGGILRAVNTNTKNTKENMLMNKPRKTLQTLQPAASRGLTRPANQVLAKSKAITQAKKVTIYSDPESVALRQDRSLQTEESIQQDQSLQTDRFSGLDRCSQTERLTSEDRSLQTDRVFTQDMGLQTERHLGQDQCHQTEPHDCDCQCHGYSAEQEAHRLMVQEEVPLEYWKELAEQRGLALNDSLHENEQLHNEVNELRQENEKLVELAGQAEYFSDVLTMLTSENGEQDEQHSETPEDQHSKPQEEQNSEPQEEQNSKPQEEQNSEPQEEQNPKPQEEQHFKPE